MTDLTVRYYIDERRVLNRWWGTRVEYDVHTDSMVLGDFKTRDEAHAAARACGFVWRGGL